MIKFEIYVDEATKLARWFVTNALRRDVTKARTLLGRPCIYPAFGTTGCDGCGIPGEQSCQESLCDELNTRPFVLLINMSKFRYSEG